jgi:hypothetical protein
MAETWVARWAGQWAASAQRFNKFHAPAGSAAGGQFTSGGGSGKGGSPAPTNAHPVGKGETGKRVSDLQARLNALGAKPPLKVDGIFGPKTLAAVRAFQEAHGLKIDGLVGPKTTAALRAGHPAKAAAHPKAGTAHAKTEHARPGAAAHHPAGRKLSTRPGSITHTQKADVRQLLKDRQVSGPDQRHPGRPEQHARSRRAGADQAPAHAPGPQAVTSRG